MANRPILQESPLRPGDWASHPDRSCAEGNPERFFPVGKGSHGVDAVAACRRCPVMKPCADYALAHPGLWGVWGGLTQNERDRRHRGKIGA